MRRSGSCLVELECRIDGVVLVDVTRLLDKRAVGGAENGQKVIRTNLKEFLPNRATPTLSPHQLQFQHPEQ